MSVDNRPDDESIAALLRNVGARAEPSADAASEVRAAVHAEWRAMVVARARRRGAYRYGVAAAAALAVLMLAAVAMIWLRQEPAMVATISAVQGSPERSAKQGARPAAASVGGVVRVGEILRTDANSRAALTVGEGLSLRLDHHSSVQFADDDRVVLDRGAVYVDSGLRDSEEELEIVTRAGVAQHVGTQYQVRQDEDEVVLSVREGRVQIEGARGPRIASAGEVLRIGHDGVVQRGQVAAHDASWRWAVQAGPMFRIENQPLSAFLEWIGRETGRTIAFVDERTRATADEIVLHGSVEGMDPDAALAAVLSTTELRAVATADDVITIETAAR